MTRRRRRAGVVALVALLVLVPAVAVLVTAGRGTSAPLDPDSAAPSGTRALAVLLRHQGVAVQRTERARAAAGAVGRAGGAATLVVTDPDVLSAARLRAAAAGARRVVLLEPGERSLRELAPALRLRYARGAAATGSPRASCADRDAAAAGRVVGAGRGALVVERRTGAATAADPVTRTCFGGIYATTTRAHQEVAVLASAELATNAHLAQHGDAALAMRALGAHRRVVWLMASALDAPASGGTTLRQLLPAPVEPALALAAVAVVAVLLWRGRRLGPVVPEALPVVVPAAETTTGRAALYRAAGSTQASAASLRAAARWRLAARLGLPAGSSAEQVADLTGAPGARAVLTGPAPRGGAELLALAADLDQLEAAVGDEHGMIASHASARAAENPGGPVP